MTDLVELANTTATRLGFPGTVEDLIFVPNGFTMQEVLTSNVWEKLKDIIDYVRHMYTESRHVFVFGVTGFYCMKFSIEKAFEVHGLHVQLDDAFKNLFIGQPPETPQDFAVYVLISYWFYSFVQMINTRIKQVTSKHEGQAMSRFGTIAEVGFPTRVLVPSDEVARFLSGRQGDLALLQDPSVQRQATQRIETFVHTILGFIEQIPENKEVAAEIFVFISASMTELVLLDLKKRTTHMMRAMEAEALSTQ